MKKLLSDVESINGVSIIAPGQFDGASAPPDDYFAFYVKFVKLGIGLPLYPFFVRILGSYDLAPAQITPNRWSQMLGMLLLWEGNGFPEPTMNEWHFMFRCIPFRKMKGFYYFTRWVKGPPMLISKLPTSSEPYRSEFFYVGTSGGVPPIRTDFGTLSRSSQCCAFVILC